MPLGDTKELAWAEAMNDLAAYAYSNALTERERVVLIGSAKTDASVCKVLARICFVARPFPARAAWSGVPDKFITAQDAAPPR